MLALTGVCETGGVFPPKNKNAPTTEALRQNRFLVHVVRQNHRSTEGNTSPFFRSKGFSLLETRKVLTASKNEKSRGKGGGWTEGIRQTTSAREPDALHGEPMSNLRSLVHPCYSCFHSSLSPASSLCLVHLASPLPSWRAFHPILHLILLPCSRKRAHDPV